MTTKAEREEIILRHLTQQAQAAGDRAVLAYLRACYGADVPAPETSLFTVSLQKHGETP